MGGINERSVVQAVSQQVTGNLPDGDVVILHLSDGVYYGLNEVGGRIWALIQQPMKVRDLQKSLLEEYDVEPDSCYQEIVNLLKKLSNHQLIRVFNEYPEATRGNYRFELNNQRS